MLPKETKAAADEEDEGDFWGCRLPKETKAATDEEDEGDFWGCRLRLGQRDGGAETGEKGRRKGEKNQSASISSGSGWSSVSVGKSKLCQTTPDLLSLSTKLSLSSMAAELTLASVLSKMEKMVPEPCGSLMRSWPSMVSWRRESLWTGESRRGRGLQRCCRSQMRNRRRARLGRVWPAINTAILLANEIFEPFQTCPFYI